MLIEFKSTHSNSYQKDFCEQAADFLLKPMRLACGRFVEVDRKLNPLAETTASKVQKVFASIAMVAFLPLTIAAVMIGMGLTACSSSYQKTSQAVNKAGCVVPSRRLPPIGPADTVLLATGKTGNGQKVFVPEHGEAVFVSDNEVHKIHPMKFLPSPFKNSKDEKHTKAIAVTENGKHVILQQGQRACAPTAIAMLVLDHGRRPNFEAIRNTDLATEDEIIQWLKEAGLNSKITSLSKESKAEGLVQLLKQNGPGALNIIDPVMGGHLIVLDAISLEDRTATIRDPYHGWMVTITLDRLLKMNPTHLIQVPKWSVIPQSIYNGVANCFSRIWKSFASCFGLCSKKTPYPQNHEFHVISNPVEIKARLAKQMQRGMEQMQLESVKSFRYQSAPLNWDKHPEKVYEEKVGPYEVGIAHAQGKRVSMEDEHIATSFHLNIAGKNYPLQLFGIFDGHGGGEASKYVRDHLKGKLEETLKEFNREGLSDAGIWKALKITAVRLNRDFKNKYGSVADRAGTTATIAMILDGKIWNANVGDSRTVLDNNGAPIQLSEDAKPNDPQYKKGIEKRGGKVWGNRVNGNLGVARAIGDNQFNGAVSARAKITVKALSEVKPDSRLILCCDGIYEAATSKDVVAGVYAHRNLSVRTLARDLIYSAHESGSTDNLSAMVIKIK